MRGDVDLGALARPAASVKPPRRSWLRIALPIAILLAFAAILVSSLGDLFRGSVEVTVVRPKPVEQGSDAATSQRIVLQAAGWVEPDPFAMQVTALASGVVREMLVLESASVKRGDPVARLVDDDAQLACVGAQAMLAEAQADLAQATAQAQIAEQTFERALGVTETEAVSAADARGRTAEQSRREAAVAQGVAQVTIAEDELIVQRELESAGAAGARQVELAEAKLAEAKGGLAALEAEAAVAGAEAEQAAARHERARVERELRLSDRSALEAARSGLERAKARVRAVQITCDEAALRLARMTVTSPADGVVLERFALPGSVLDAASGGAAVCTLYDPAHLRVRVDVPQGDLAKLSVGQQAEILSEARAGKPYRGEVIRLVQKADIQKVTLQAHVRIVDGDALLRPEMLCQVRFFGNAAAGGAAAGAASTDTVLIPAHLVVDGNAVWVIDGAKQAAARRTVEVGAKAGDWVEIRSGLNVSDKLIDEGRAAVSEGARVTIRGGL
jgi:HlyD family secretion protein